MTNRNVVTGSAAAFSDHDLAIPTDSTGVPCGIAKSTHDAAAASGNRVRATQLKLEEMRNLFGGREA